MRNDDMRDDDLKRALAEEEIIPSSGFVSSVMEAVKREATAPPPIPFPWMRALPGFTAAGLVLAVVIFEFIKHIGRSAVPDSSSRWVVILKFAFDEVSTAAARPDVGWIALALLLAFASLVISVRLVPGRLQ